MDVRREKSKIGRKFCGDERKGQPEYLKTNVQFSVSTIYFPTIVGQGQELLGNLILVLLALMHIGNSTSKYIDRNTSFPKQFQETNSYFSIMQMRMNDDKNILTLILNAPRTLDRTARRAIGALQQPAQKLSPARSATIPTYQQQQQQARAATIYKREILLNRFDRQYHLHSGQSIIELHKPEFQSFSKPIKCSVARPRGCVDTGRLPMKFYDRYRNL